MAGCVDGAAQRREERGEMVKWKEIDDGGTPGDGNASKTGVIVFGPEAWI